MNEVIFYVDNVPIYTAVSAIPTSKLVMAADYYTSDNYGAISFTGNQTVRISHVRWTVSIRNPL